MPPIEISFQDRDTAIRTMVGEASNQGPEGLAAVAWVILNRVNWTPPSWWGATVFNVCKHPRQFSCWNGGPDFARILTMETIDLEYRDAAAVIDKVIAGKIADPTGGATTYKVRGTDASWDKAVAGQEPVSIGKHDFWRLAPTGECLAALAPAPVAEAIHA